MKPVIVVVAYKRIHTLKRLLDSIGKAVYRSKDITLIISIDYHPENSEIIECARLFRWIYGEKIIKTHDENMGLKRHIIECGDYALSYGAAIILEDDEVVAPTFYEYAKQAHEFYCGDERIAGISLYGHEWNDYAGKKFQPVFSNGDVYFGQFSCTRGQSWSAEQWKNFRTWYTDRTEVKCDELLPPPIYKWRESWGKYFVRYLIEEDKYYVIPRRPVSTVFGEVGTHASKIELEFQIALYWGEEKYCFIPFESGCHYDIFFENKDLQHVLAERFGISEKEICIDLYALAKRQYGDKRYILTTRKLDYKILESYDLNMRPHDINVLSGIGGKGIFLYDTDERKRNKEYSLMARLEYDFAGVHGPEAFLYAWIHCWQILLYYFK